MIKSTEIRSLGKYGGEYQKKSDREKPLDGASNFPVNILYQIVSIDTLLPYHTTNRY